MSCGTIDFYFDIISPFSYIAFEVLLQYEKQLQLKINFKPVSIGHVFQNAGNKPPALCPAKAKYNFYDLPRLAKYWNVPFKNVTDFATRVLKGNTSKVQHFLVAVNVHQPNDFRRLMRAFWHRLYCNDKDIFSEADIREVCREERVENVEKLIELSKSDSVKQIYRDSTQEAVESGAFGVPFIVVKVNGQKPSKLFGTDRLHVLFHELGVPFRGALELAKL